MNRLVDYGMDTIAYLPSPADNTKLLSVVTDHGWFILKGGVQSAEEVAKKYFNSYDIGNNKDATKFFIDSLDEDTARHLYENCDTLLTFASHWLHLIAIVRSTSFDRFKAVQDQVCDRKIKEYDADDVELLCGDYLNNFEELHNAGMYDHQLTLVMIQ